MKPHTTKQIAGVNIDVENAMATHGSSSKDKLKEIYFNHLNDEDAEFSAQELYAELKGKQAPATAADVQTLGADMQPVIADPIVTSNKK